MITLFQHFKTTLIRSCVVAVLGAAYLAAQAAAPAVGKTVVLENFESYTNDLHLAKIWYKPPHGGETRQTLETTRRIEGKQSMRWDYTTTTEEKTRYSAICRVSKWDASGCNAIQFWLQPDGSGRKLTVQLNIANRQGRNIHDLWQTDYFPARGDSSPRIVTIPFASLQHNVKYADSPDTSPVFKPEALIEIAFYVGHRDQPGTGAYYFDDIKAVQLDGPAR